MNTGSIGGLILNFVTGFLFGFVVYFIHPIYLLIGAGVLYLVVKILELIFRGIS
jgi:hypothetical protein